MPRSSSSGERKGSGADIVIDKIFQSRRLFASLAVLMVTAFVVLHLRPAQDRPIGSIEDLPKLRERDDLNVIFVLIDTLRADRLGVYDYGRDTSPTLDRLAREGIRFTRHVAQSSWTKSSMASLWTASNPAHTGVHRYMHALPEQATMPAEIFRESGFRTTGIWRNGWVAPNFGFGQGFDTYARPNPGPVSPQIYHEHPGATVPGSDIDATRAAIEFLRTVREGDRFLLYLHLMDVHQYTSDMESAIFGTTYSDLYDNAIHWTDRNLARLLEDLGARDLLRRTIIVIAADHGEAFREHQFEGHARNLYAEVIETPLIISLPFRLEEPLVVESPSANVDIWPTILDLLDLPGLDLSDGRSLVASIEAAAREEVLDPERSIFSDLDTGWGSPRKRSNRTVALTRGAHRAHELNEEGFELYNLESDSGERADLSDRDPDLREELRAEIAAYVQGGEPRWRTEEIELDEMMLNQLRALGYKIE